MNTTKKFKRAEPKLKCRTPFKTNKKKGQTLQKAASCHTLFYSLNNLHIDLIDFNLIN